MVERSITFYSDGLKLRGTLYLPEGLPEGQRLPVVVACSGYLGLNAIYPRLFAQALTPRGFVVLGFDYRGTGFSEGQFGRILVEEQVKDIKSAITFARLQPEVDPERIALLGWGMGAGNVVQVAAYDGRVRAVIALNGFYGGERFLQVRNGAEGFQRLLERLEEDRIQRTTTGQGRFGDAYEAYPLDPDTAEEVGRNLEPVPRFGPPPTAFELVDSLLAFEPEAVVARIAPRPLFIGHGEGNRLHPPAEALSLYERAREPKTLYWIPGKHNDFMQLEHPVFQRLSADLDTWLRGSLGVGQYVGVATGSD
jgi:fermentation-respiration switch protein FrsA (DUF1100 family)